MSVGKTIFVKDNIRRIVQGEDLILSVGVEHNSLVNPENDNKLHFLWTKDGQPLGTEEGDLRYHNYNRTRAHWDRPTITLNKLIADDSGVYQCEISNHFGTVLSEPTTVEVLDVLNNPLLSRNIVQNGEQRVGDQGWSVIEGAMEQLNPYFWDDKKLTGWCSTWDLRPRVFHVIDPTIYVPPIDGDRLLGQWSNRSRMNEVKIQQDIDIRAISDVVDRNIEGITEVDLRCSGWLIGYRFNSNKGGYNTKNEKINWRRGTSSNNSLATMQDHPAFWHIKTYFVDDTIKLNFILFNEAGEEIKRIQHENVKNSYQNTLACLKHRRIDMPKGTRMIRVEIIATRDGRRIHDGSWDGVLYKLIKTGAWGINARIIVNNIEDKFNKNYEMWDMPRRSRLNPAVPNYKMKQNVSSEMPAWNDLATWEEGQKGQIRNTPYGLSSWIGAPVGGYRNSDGSIKNYHKCFNIWRPSNDISEDHQDSGIAQSDWVGFDPVKKTDNGTGTTYTDIYFGKPTMIRDAAMATLNLKKMNLHWMMDYNHNMMDQSGKDVLYFQFSVPAIQADQADLATVMGKRRTLRLPGANLVPVLSQKLLAEDIDQAIYNIHKETSNFRPHLNLLEGQRGAWEFEGSDEEKYFLLKSQLYNAFKFIMTTQLPHTQYFSSWMDFINNARSNYDLNQMYWSLSTLYWFLMDWVPNELPSNGITRGQMSGLIDYMADKLKYNEILNELRIITEIPEDKFLEKEEVLLNWIKKRLCFHILDCAFRSMLWRTGWEHKHDEYKDAFNTSSKREIVVASNNLYATIPSDE